MSTFTAWTFDTVDGAAAAARLLKDASNDGLTTILDSVVVEWPADAERPTTTDDDESRWRGAGRGALWGALFGSVFLAPFVGAAAGAALGGARPRGSNDAAIPSSAVTRVRDAMAPGTSALFVVTENGDRERVGERFHGVKATLVDTNLTIEEQALLMQTFGS